MKTTAPDIAAVIATAPVTYNFSSKFNGESSVSYTGQTFRQLLINDIKNAMSSQLRNSSFYAKEEIVEMLNSYYRYDENNPKAGDLVIDGITDFTITAYDTNGRQVDITEGFVYSDVQSPGKNLADKLAGNDNPLRRGRLYGTNQASTPEDYVNLLFDEFAENTVNGKNFTVPNGALAPQTIHSASVTEDGRDLAQLVQKFFHSAISYSQAAGDYLSTTLGANKGLKADNTKPSKAGSTYTNMEHHFDEAYGYFGGARGFGLQTDKQIQSSLSGDLNGDGAISLESEMNLGLSKNFGRVDVLAADQDLDLTKEVMDAFIAGRYLIAQAPAGYEQFVEAYSQVALGAWEKTLAAVSIIYINLTIKEYEQYGTFEYKYEQFVKYWSEMKGFAFAFQFNPKGIMSDAEFDQLHALMADKPVLPHANKADVDTYKNNLIAARNLLGSTYGFSANNVANW